jgi:hypothetical protein
MGAIECRKGTRRKFSVHPDVVHRNVESTPEHGNGLIDHCVKRRVVSGIGNHAYRPTTFGLDALHDSSDLVSAHVVDTDKCASTRQPHGDLRPYASSGACDQGSLARVVDLNRHRFSSGP